MSGKIMALCDTEEEYAQHMTEFLKSQSQLPWMIYTYTDVRQLMSFLKQQTPGLLVVAENAYTEEVQELTGITTVLLNESGVVKWKDIHNVNKYQRADQVLREILQVLMELEDAGLPELTAGISTKIIGMYSPVRRCLQTSFALTLGQMLAEKHKTLYLNFEHYAGITELLPDIQTRDLADLIFFLTSDRNKFRLRMQTMIHKKGRLDYIPPMRAGQNLITIAAAEWMNLIQELLRLGDYEFMILDLTENMQGLFDILRMCYMIFTLTREDMLARSKITQYEQLLALCNYSDVLDKTHKYVLPVFKRLPEQLEQFTRGELADYVRGVMKEVTG